MESSEEFPKLGPISLSRDSSLLESMLTGETSSGSSTSFRGGPPLISPPSCSSSSSASETKHIQWNPTDVSPNRSNQDQTSHVSSKSITPSSNIQTGTTVPKRPSGTRPRKEDPLSKIPTSRKGPVVKLKRLNLNLYMKGQTTTNKNAKKSEDTFLASNMIGGMTPTPESTPGTPLHEFSSDFTEPIVLSDRLTDEPEIEEMWPGKVCAFCNMGERSQLGQGELLRLEVGGDFEMLRQSRPDRQFTEHSALSQNAGGVNNFDRGTKHTSVAGSLGIKKPRLSFKGRRSSSFDAANSCSELQEELNMIGFTEEPDLSTIIEQGVYFYVHQTCALWSKGVCRSGVDYTLSGVDSAMLRAISQKCAVCNSYGAGLCCAMSGCTKSYHFPCAVSCGAYFNVKTSAVHCVDHIHQGSIIAGNDAQCVVCHSPGNVTNQLFCVTCGRHYHGSCIGLSTAAGVRTAWQCPDCKVCVTCRAPGEDSKMLVCDTCDKSYHPYCVRPLLSNIPKLGWKCKNCRVCGDCGARTPGSGPSSRWHACFTVCDSCYQQRNKGVACPICGKAYRHSQREMSSCQRCRKYVHSSCDPEADRGLIQRKKDLNPDYEYHCPVCKQSQVNWQQHPYSSDCDLPGILRGSLESLPSSEDYNNDADVIAHEETATASRMLTGRGKPLQSVGKIARKKMGGAVGRPKGSGKAHAGNTYNRKPKVTDFGRKRGPKPKMRGVFGVPGLGLQRPQSDGSTGINTEGEPCLENRLVLCSAQDEFVLEQDACVMCGSFGLDQEGRLIACAQCGQCYHPYCANVKVTKVILQKGWRCLDCTVCEGCGQRNDEARLLLCDECDISYHIYCMDPPLDYVPQGNWKCKWCAICQACGSNDSGFNSSWLNNYSLCGPCASLKNCPSCSKCYNEEELIIQCQQCNRWLHAVCDLIRNESEAERCAEEGYTCILCRPSDVPPPHLNPNYQLTKITSPPKSPILPVTEPSSKPKSQAQFLVDGVCLSEGGMNHLRSLQLDQPRRRVRGKGKVQATDTEADQADGEKGDGDADDTDLLKDGTILTPREDGRLPDVPDGYSVVQGEGGVLILRKKRQRNLQKLGIGGFQVRRPWARVKDKEEDALDTTEVTLKDLPNSSGNADGSGSAGDSSFNAKPKRKPKRKPKNKLVETYPVYLQEAFFGKELLDVKKSAENIEGSMGISSDSENDGPIQPVKEPSTIQLSREEAAVLDAIKHRAVVSNIQPAPTQSSSMHVRPPQQPVQRPMIGQPRICEPTLVSQHPTIANHPPVVRMPAVRVPLNPALRPPAPLRPALPVSQSSVPVVKREELDDVNEDTEALKDILPFSGELLDSDDLVDSIMKSGEDDLNEENNHLESSGPRSSPKDELTDILSPHFNLDTMVSESGLPNMDSKDVEDIFKVVLTDESQESGDSSYPSVNATPSPAGPPSNVSSTVGLASATYVPHVGPQSAQPVPLQGPAIVRAISASQGTASPGAPPPPSPYLSEYSSSPSFSPAFSEPPPSPWPTSGTEHDGEATTVNQRNALKWEADETLGLNATISAVLYANTNHPDLKRDFPAWTERWKQIAKIWRALPSEKKAPFLQKAKENRAAVRLQKSHQNQQDTEKSIPVHRRVVETEQERQWKQLQALRQQQHQQQLSGTVVTAPVTVDATPTSVPVNNQSFATPIQVSRVRPPEVPGPQGPTFLPRGPVQQLRPNLLPGSSAVRPGVLPQQLHQQQESQNGTDNSGTCKNIEASLQNVEKDASMTGEGIANQEPNDAARQQLRDLLQRQNQMGKKEETDVSPTHLQHRPQFRHPLPPGAAMQGSPRHPGYNPMTGPHQQQQIIMQRPRLPNPQTAEFRHPTQINHDPRPRLPMQPRQLHSGQVVHQGYTMNYPVARQSTPTMLPSGGTVLHNAQQQHHTSITNTLQQPASEERTTSLPAPIKSEPLTSSTETRSTALPIENPDTEPDDDLPYLGVDDDELFKIGNDFNILEYADPELHDAQDGKGRVSATEGETGSPSMGNDFNILEYADADLDTGDEGTRKGILDDHLELADEVSKKEAEENAAKVAEGVSEFQAKLLEFTQKQQQQNSENIGPQNTNAEMLHPPNTPMPSPCTPSSGTLPSQQQHTMGNFPYQPQQPPPPYRGPPPPYPGPSRPQQEQPLLLEDLLEQEKRELQRHQIQQPNVTPEKPFLSDTDFEKLKADVLAAGASVSLSPPAIGGQSGIAHQTGVSSTFPQNPHVISGGVSPQNSVPVVVVGQRITNYSGHPLHTHQQQQPQFIRAPMQQQWQMQQNQQPMSVRPPQDPGIHPALLQSQNLRPPLPPQLLPAPPLPPENPTNDNERQQQTAYEQWLIQQQHLIRLQQTYYETEVSKFRKQRKSLNSRQRQLRKNGQELNESDATDLERITTEQSGLQKQLDQVRRQSRQHSMLVQDYRTKQQKRQQQQLAQQPLNIQGAAPMGEGNNFSGFPPQQSQSQVQLQQHLQTQSQQQPSPRAGGRAVTPQSPHLLSPCQNMSVPLRSPHIGQQHMNIQSQSSNPMVINQQHHGMIGGPSPVGGMQQTQSQNISVMGTPNQNPVVSQQQGVVQIPGPPPSPAPQQQHHQSQNIVGGIQNSMIQQPQMCNTLQQPTRSVGQPHPQLTQNVAQQNPMMQQYQQPNMNPMVISHPNLGGQQQNISMMSLQNPAQQQSQAAAQTQMPVSQQPNVMIGPPSSPVVSQLPHSVQTVGPSQSPRLAQQNSVLVQQQQSTGPSQSPMMHQPPRPGIQQPQQQQRPMPAPSPMMNNMQHSPMPVAMTPIPSPGISNSTSTAAHLQQQQPHSASPMAQHSPHTSMMPSPRMGTPLSQHSEEAASPFSPGPMSSPQPVLNVMRLTSPQSHPPRLPSPQQAMGTARMLVTQNVPTQGGNPPGIRTPQMYTDQNSMMRPVAPGQEVARMHPAMMQRFARPTGTLQGDNNMILRQRYPMTAALQQAAQIQNMQIGGNNQPNVILQSQQAQLNQQQIQQHQNIQQNIQQQQQLQQNMQQQFQQNNQQQQFQQNSQQQQFQQNIQQQQQFQQQNAQQQQFQQQNAQQQQMQHQNMQQQNVQVNQQPQPQMSHLQQHNPQQMQQQMQQHVQQQNQHQLPQIQNPGNYSQHQHQYPIQGTPPSPVIAQQQQQQQQYNMMNPMQQGQYQYQNHLIQSHSHHQFQQQQHQMYVSGQNVNQSMMRPTLTYSQPNTMHRPIESAGVLGSPRTPHPSSVPQSPVACSHPGTPGGNVSTQPVASPASVQASSNLASPGAAVSSDSQNITEGNHPETSGGGNATGNVMPFIEYDSYGFPKLGLKGGSPLSPGLKEAEQSGRNTVVPSDETVTQTIQSEEASFTADTVLSSSAVSEVTIDAKDMQNDSKTGIKTENMGEYLNEASKNDSQFYRGINCSQLQLTKSDESSTSATKSGEEFEISKEKDLPNVILKQESGETNTSGSNDDGHLQQQHQNALLKQLLQGSTSTVSVTTSTSTVTTAASRAPSLMGLLSTPVTQNNTNTNSGNATVSRSILGAQSLASQLAQPIAPPPATIPADQIAQIVSRVPQPTPIVPPQNVAVVRPSSQPLPTPATQTPITAPVTSSTFARPQQTTTSVPVNQQSIIPVKQEILTEPSIHPALAGVKLEVEETDSQECTLSSEQTTPESRKNLSQEEARKLKRRQYQQKRRQSCAKEGPVQPNSSVTTSGVSLTTTGSSTAISGGNASNSGQSKKRFRKGSKYEEDYDAYIESTMSQLRSLPPLSILEPHLGRNFSVCPVFGSGDLSRLSDRGTRAGNLKGAYGAGVIAGVSDYYNTYPFGDSSPVPAIPLPPAQRGFYHQEFAWPRLGLEDGKCSRGSSPARDTDTPDTVISSSSPECVLPETPVRYPGLKYIEESDNEDNSESTEDKASKRCYSPDIPLCAPTPIRPVVSLQPKDVDEVDKENQGLAREQQALKARFGLSPPVPLKDSANVTVTLTLSAAAAEDVTNVLCRLASLLRVPPPSGFQIIERTTTPPSQRLGLYRFKGKDGKEGVPVDIQSILNGTAKFCRHCDVVILGGSMISKKASLFTNHALSEPISSMEEDFYFCSSSCFVQFAVTNRVGLTPEEKAAAVVDHLSSTELSTKPNTEIVKNDPNTAAAAAANILCGATAAAAALNKSLPLVQPGTAFSQEVSVPNKSIRRAEQDTIGFPPVKKWKGIKYRYWSSTFQQQTQQQKKFKKPTDNELTDMLYRSGICIRPAKMPEDKRKCMFCHQYGDGVSDGPARLLNFDVDRWVHLNCALWHEEVFEMVNGALMNVDVALKQSLIQTCVHCQQIGATVKCFKLRCSSVYHLGCAIKESCVFFKNKSVYCSQHVPKGDKEDQLTTLAVFRRVYVNRDENRQVAAVMHHSDQNYLLRVGSLTFLSVGQLLPHQLAAFHSPNCIYPIGYQIVRFYWSPRVVHKRCRYVCSIEEVEGRPLFTVVIQERERNLEDITYKDWTCQGVWQQILSAVEEVRKNEGMVRLFPQFLNGEDLFGLTEPAIVRVLESLPGIESLGDYNFKYGRNPLLEFPLAVNPTGCARSEPKLRTHFKRLHAQRTVGSSRVSYNQPSSSSLDVPGPYSKQFVHSKSSQYKKMKQEWRHNVYLARSKIQGLGLYAARDIEKHTMVIEYIGEIIRAELAECREKRYDAQNRGIYMFRLDEQRVIDATLSGGLARYINHSCNPNCVAEAVEVERDLRIIIFANRRINRGEELSYDYKFDIEDDHKIPCLCGAPNCRKWMN